MRLDGKQFKKYFDNRILAVNTKHVLAKDANQLQAIYRKVY